MVSTHKLSDFQPPMLIDMGSDTVKFAHPILNTCKISQDILNKRNQENETPGDASPDGTPSPGSTSPEEEEEMINANSIYDYKHYLKSFPTILGLLPESSDFLKFFKNPQLITSEFSKLFSEHKDLKAKFAVTFPDKKAKEFETAVQKVKIPGDLENILNMDAHELNYLRFGNEPVWKGMYDMDKWEHLMNIVTMCQFGNNADKNIYTDIPLIFTQQALPIETLYTQVKQIYERAFETFKAPYVLICSQAMVNLISFNLSSGVVVDMGESGTSITPVRDGFAMYNSSVHSEFLSGRNITGMLGMMKKDISAEDDDKCQMTFKEYHEAKLEKENSETFTCMTKENEGGAYSHLSYLYFYPEIFKRMKQKNLPHSLIREFIVKQFNEKMPLNEDNRPKRWNEMLFEDYLSSTETTLEKLLLQRNTNYLSTTELNHYKYFSLPHLICAQLQEYMNDDLVNANKYSKIVFTGGALKTKYLKNELESELKRMLIHQSKSSKFFEFGKDGEWQMNFYKGANFLSKIDNLDTIMVSNQDYYDLGAEYLCYHYI